MCNFLYSLFMKIAADEHKKFKRIRWVKKILRYLPRRASIHNYPILKHFSSVIKKRSYLWSFRVNDVIPAFYVGWIITLLPIPSICQIFIALLAAIFCCANVMILVGLQLLSNPFTFIFLWAITHKVGAFIVSILGTEAVSAMIQEACDSFTWSIGGCCKTAIRWIATTVLGAIILGSILGFISSFIYKFFAKRSVKSVKSPQVQK